MGLRNYFNNIRNCKYAGETWAIALDAALAGIKLNMGIGAVLVGASAIITTLVEDAAPVAGGVANDIPIIIGGLELMAQGTKLQITVISDMFDLAAGNYCQPCPPGPDLAGQ